MFFDWFFDWCCMFALCVCMITLLLDFGFYLDLVLFSLVSVTACG